MTGTQKDWRRYQEAIKAAKAKIAEGQARQKEGAEKERQARLELAKAKAELEAFEAGDKSQR